MKDGRCTWFATPAVTLSRSITRWAMVALIAVLVAVTMEPIFVPAAPVTQVIGGINFNTLEGYPGSILYQQGVPEATARSFGELYAAAQPEVSTLFGASPPATMSVFLFASEAERIKGLQNIAGIPPIQAAQSRFDAATLAGGNILVDAQALQRAEEAQRFFTLARELARSVVRGILSAAVAPRWLEEGMAGYAQRELGTKRYPLEAGREAAELRRAVLDAYNGLRATQLYALSDLSADRDWDLVQRLSLGQRVARGQAYMAVDIMAQRYGWPSVLAILGLLAGGASLDDAISTAVGITSASLEQELIAGLAPESARSAPAVRFTVTISPGGSTGSTKIVIGSRIGQGTRAVGAATAGPGQYEFQVDPAGQITSADGKVSFSAEAMLFPEEGLSVAIRDSVYRGSRGQPGAESVDYRYDYGVYTPARKYYSYQATREAETQPGMPWDPFPDGNSVSALRVIP